MPWTCATTRSWVNENFDISHDGSLRAGTVEKIGLNFPDRRRRELLRGHYENAHCRLYPAGVAPVFSGSASRIPRGANRPFFQGKDDTNYWWYRWILRKLGPYHRPTYGKAYSRQSKHHRAAHARRGIVDRRKLRLRSRET